MENAVAKTAVRDTTAPRPYGPYAGLYLQNPCYARIIFPVFLTRGRPPMMWSRVFRIQWMCGLFAVLTTAVCTRSLDIALAVACGVFIAGAPNGFFWLWMGGRKEPRSVLRAFYGAECGKMGGTIFLWSAAWICFPGWLAPHIVPVFGGVLAIWVSYGVMLYRCRETGVVPASGIANG